MASYVPRNSSLIHPGWRKRLIVVSLFVVAFFAVMTVWIYAEGVAPWWVKTIMVSIILAYSLILVLTMAWPYIMRGDSAALQCPRCNGEVRANYVACPRCTLPLKRPCPSCNRRLPASYRACPHCGHVMEPLANQATSEHR